MLFAALLSACVGGKSDGGSRTYTVSGKVVYETENGKPAAGVRIQLTGATESEVITDGQGRWEAVFKGTGTATPSKEGFEFEPESMAFDKKASGADFIARCILPAYAVSGVVEDENGNGIAGVTISFESEIKDYEPVITDNQGAWEKPGLQGSVRIIPSHQDYTFDPEHVEVDSAQTGIVIAAKFAAAYSVSGSVKNPDGNGVAGVMIRFASEKYIYESVTTDKEGNWSKSGLTGTVEISPWAAGKVTFTPSSVEVSGPRSDIVFNMGLYFNRSGTIVDVEGQPLAGIMVECSNTSGDTVSVVTCRGLWTAKTQRE